MLRLIVFPCLYCAVLGHALAQPLHVIPLNHRSAEELIPLLEPLLDDDMRLSGHNDQLLLRALPVQAEVLRTTIETLDQPRTDLIVSLRLVRTTTGATGEGGLTDENQDGRHVLGSTRRRRSNEQQLRVRDGGSGQLQLDDEQLALEVYPTLFGVELARSDFQQRLGQQLDVEARRLGSQIELHLRLREDTPPAGLTATPSTSTRRRAQLETSLRIPSGRWVDLGGQQSRRQAVSSNTTRRYGTGGDADALRLQVRVDPAPL